MTIPRTSALILLLSLPLFACGRKGSDTASADSASVDSTAVTETPDTSASASAENRTAEPTDASSQPVSIGDIDRWQKGIAGETRALEAVAAKMKAAKTTPEKLSVMAEAQEGSTTAAGAKAAGLDESRYDFVRAKLSGVVAYLAPPEIPGMDTASIPQSQRDQLRAEREDYLKKTAWAVPPDVVEALKPRAAELRKQDMELVAARAKALGMQ